MPAMKRILVLLLTVAFLTIGSATMAQCSICTKTAQQMGEKPAKALNGGIVYLAATPMAILIILGFRWWKANKDMF
jgi:hypothetical protein